MKKIYASLIIIMMFMTACQPTPEELIVQNKADGELMDKIETTAGIDAVTSEQVSENTQENVLESDKDNGYKVIGHETFEQTLVNGMHLVADADVIMPDTETFPVVKYRRKQFTQSDIDNILITLIGNKSLYEYEIPMTKTQIEAEIVKLRQYLNESDRTEEEKENLNITIEEWMKRYDDAPDTSGLVEKSRQPNENGMIYGVVSLGENDYASINILPKNENRENFDDQMIGVRYSRLGKDNSGSLSNKLNYIRQIKLGDLSENPNIKERPDYHSTDSDWNYDITIEPVENAAGKINMTSEGAINIAEETFRNMGAGDDVKVSNIYYLYIPEDANCPKEDVHCYAIELKRYVGDMPIVVATSSSEGMTQRSNDGSDEFNSNMPQECMSVFISDDGIIDLEWREPIEAVEMMNQNVELSSYEKISEVFSQEFVNSYSAYSWRTEDETNVNETTGSSQTYYAYSPCKLYSIELNYGLARVPNENGFYMAIPLWDFYASYSAKSVAIRSDGREIVMDTANDYSLLTINGIDNSRFSRRWGY